MLGNYFRRKNILGKKKPIVKTIGELAMRKARIFNYYNKRPHKERKEV
jgi:hypothetical protein